MALRLLRLASSDRPRNGEAGFALIEVIVSAAVLAMVALAVLAGVDAAGRSTGREKARSVGVGLAEQDQERMRALPAVDVEGAGGTKTVLLNGASYTVDSTVEWVNDATGGTPSCDNDGKEASYLRITSRVTSQNLSAPVVLSSLVEPPISKSGAGQGTLAVQVNDRNGKGVPDVDVTTTNGPDPDKTATTNASGCAVFGKIGAGNYDLLLSKTGYVDDHGRGAGQGASGSATVSNQVASVVTLRYDLAAPWKFQFKTGNPITSGTTATNTDLLATTSGAIAASNALVSDLLTWSVATPAATMDVNLFPFTAAYSVFAGHCAEADPLTVYGSDYYTDFPSFGGQVAANPGVAGPISPPTTIIEPPLRVRVMNGSTPLTGTTTKVKVTSVDCADVWTIGVTGNTTPGTGFTNSTGAGYATFSSTTYDPGVPYGDYSVCAQASISGTLRHSGPTSVTLNDPFAGRSTVTNVAVTSSSALNACP